jgi:hypothetical protein
LGEILENTEQTDKEAVDGAEHLLCPLSNEQPCYRSDCAWWVEGEGLIGRCAVATVAIDHVIAGQINGPAVVINEFDFTETVKANLDDDAMPPVIQREVEDRTYSVGTLTNPKPDDQRFGFFEEAVKSAIQASSWDDFVWGVWNDDSGELLAIVYQGRVYIE